MGVNRLPNDEAGLQKWNILSMCGSKLYKLLSRFRATLSRVTSLTMNSWDSVRIIGRVSYRGQNFYDQIVKRRNLYRILPRNSIAYVMSIVSAYFLCDMLRDKIVGINDDKIQRRLLTEKETLMHLILLLSWNRCQTFWKSKARKVNKVYAKHKQL